MQFNRRVDGFSQEKREGQQPCSEEAVQRDLVGFVEHLLASSAKLRLVILRAMLLHPWHGGVSIYGLSRLFQR